MRYELVRLQAVYGTSKSVCRYDALYLSLYTPYYVCHTTPHPGLLSSLPIQPQFLHQRLDPPQEHPIVDGILRELIARHLAVQRPHHALRLREL